MSSMVCQTTSLTIVYSTVYLGADQRKHQSSASLAFVRWIHRWPVNSLHKGPVTRKMFPFDDVIMKIAHLSILVQSYIWARILVQTHSRLSGSGWADSVTYWQRLPQASPGHTTQTTADRQYWYLQCEQYRWRHMSANTCQITDNSTVRSTVCSS